MAKKKNQDSNEPSSDAWRSKWKSLGDIFIPATAVATQERQVLSVSPALDIALNGGILEGTWTTISGLPKSGKSTLCLQVAKSAIAKNRPVFYIDVEGRFKKLNLTSVQGLDLTNFTLIQSTKDHVLSAEEFLEVTIDICKNVPEACIILDSASSLCSSQETISDVTGQFRSLTPRILATFTRRLACVVPVQLTTMLVVIHLQSNLSGYGATLIDSGGSKITYQADTRLRIKSSTKWQDTDNRLIGQDLKVLVETSALGPPGEADCKLRYNFGFDPYAEVAQLMQQLGFAEKKGAWITINIPDFNYETKFCGDNAFGDFLKNNEEAFNELRTKIYESCGLKWERNKVETKTETKSEPLPISPEDTPITQKIDAL